MRYQIAAYIVVCLGLQLVCGCGGEPPPEPMGDDRLSVAKTYVAQVHYRYKHQKSVHAYQGSLDILLENFEGAPFHNFPEHEQTLRRILEVSQEIKAALAGDLKADVSTQMAELEKLEKSLPGEILWPLL